MMRFGIGFFLGLQDALRAYRNDRKRAMIVIGRKTPIVSISFMAVPLEDGAGMIALVTDPVHNRVLGYTWVTRQRGKTLDEIADVMLKFDIQKNANIAFAKEVLQWDRM